MATYNLRRFANPPSSPNGLDYERLVGVLMDPAPNTPEALLDALFFVNEMSTDECMDILLEEAETNGLALDGKPDPTAADVAAQVFLQDKALLERKHAEQYLTRPRSFEYFQIEVRPVPAFKQPSRESLTALEHDLDNWFEKKKRGRGSRVFVYPKEDDSI